MEKPKKKIKRDIYRKPHIGMFMAAICEKYKIDPAELKSFLFHNFPELKNKEKCANCEASMREYPCTLTYFVGELLCEMAQIVHNRLEKFQFTEANQVHRKEITKGYTIASQFTISAKLGLVAKIMTKNEAGDAVHDMEKGWCITSRGFEFLAGKPVPAKVMVFRNRIQERFDEMITMAEVYKGEVKTVDRLLKISAEIMERYHTPKLL